jgi:hypothetical protein
MLDNKNLMRLNLSSNALAGESCNALATALKERGCPLVIIDLSSNNIEDSHLSVLHVALEGNMAVTSLDLRLNKISEGEWTSSSSSYHHHHHHHLERMCMFLEYVQAPCGDAVDLLPEVPGCFVLKTRVHVCCPPQITRPWSEYWRSPTRTSWLLGVRRQAGGEGREGRACIYLRAKLCLMVHDSLIRKKYWLIADG